MNSPVSFSSAPAFRSSSSSHAMASPMVSVGSDRPRKDHGKLDHFRRFQFGGGYVMQHVRSVNAFFRLVFFRRDRRRREFNDQRRD